MTYSFAFQTPVRVTERNPNWITLHGVRVGD